MPLRQLIHLTAATWMTCSVLVAHAQAPAAPPPPAATPTSPTPPPSAATPPAAATANSPDLEAAAPPPAASTPAAPTIAAPAPNPQALQMLRVFAERERSGRIAGAYSMFISGAAVITAGIVADAVYDRYYGKPLWIIGAVVELGGVISLVRAGTFEGLADEAQSYSPDQLQSEWSQRALLARMGRKIGGVVSFVLGGLVIGTGAAIAAGLGDLKREQKQDWTTALIASGGGIVGSGFVSLLVESPIENAYRSVYGTDAGGDSSLSLNVAPTVGGAALQLRAAF